MKKLLITSMAAVAIGLCAKAEFTANESFEKNAQDENLAEGPFFLVDDETGNYIYGLDWTSEATPEDGIFTVTNITKITTEGDSYPTDRPLSGDNVNALAIDTEKSLIRKVISSASDQLEGALLEGEGGAPIFFDSVVQFTATDAKPTPGNDDKLMVWLYASDDVDNDNPGVFGETTPTTNLIITAGYNESGTFVVTNYLTGVEIAPDSWHRLTIKSFKDSGYLKFNVWVDETLVKVGTESDFISLQLVNSINDTTLKGVAFDGKGAVDDLVFTTTAPEFAEGGGDSDNANVCISINNLDAIDFEYAGVTLYVNPDTEDEAYHDITTASTNILLKVGDAIKLEFSILDGYTLDNPTEATFEEGIYIVEYSELTSSGATIEIVATSTGGGGSGEEPEPEDPAKPTIGEDAVDNADAFIAAANSGVTIKVPTDWTLDGNTLKYANGVEYATFADYYTVTLATDGTVTLKLNDNAKPTIDETAADKGDAIVVTDAAVALGVTNAKVGLWYGVQAYSDAACTKKIGDEPTGWEKATGETVTVTATKPEGDKAFFKVVVDDQDHSSEEQN